MGVSDVPVSENPQNYGQEHELMPARMTIKEPRDKRDITTVRYRKLH